MSFDEEHVISWLQEQIKKWTQEVIKRKRWVEESQEDVKKANQMLQGFKYRLEEAEAILQYLKDMLVIGGINPSSEVLEPW